jgi:hypothetical protein
MNEVDFLRRLAAKSQGESSPTLDVAARVINNIARQRRRELDLRLPLVGICAVAVSVLAILATLPASKHSDGLAAISEAAVNSTGPEALLRVFE